MPPKLNSLQLRVLIHYAKNGESTIYHAVYKARDKINGDYSDVKKAVRMLEDVGYIASTRRRDGPRYRITGFGAEYLLSLNRSDSKPPDFELEDQMIETLAPLTNIPTRRIVMRVLDDFDQRLVYHEKFFLNSHLLGRKSPSSSKEIVKLTRSIRRNDLSQEQLQDLLSEYLPAHPVLSFYLQSQEFRNLFSQFITLPEHDNGKISKIVKSALPPSSQISKKMLEHRRFVTSKLLSLLDT